MLQRFAMAQQLADCRAHWGYGRGAQRTCVDAALQQSFGLCPQCAAATKLKLFASTLALQRAVSSGL
jgi:hypothetical protein